MVKIPEIVSAIAIAPAPARVVRIGVSRPTPQLGQPSAIKPNIAPIPPVLAPSSTLSFWRCLQAKISNTVANACRADINKIDRPYQLAKLVKMLIQTRQSTSNLRSIGNPEQISCQLPSPSLKKFRMNKNNRSVIIKHAKYFGLRNSSWIVTKAYLVRSYKYSPVS